MLNTTHVSTVEEWQEQHELFEAEIGGHVDAPCSGWEVTVVDVSPMADCFDHQDVVLSKKEAEFVRTLIRVKTDLDVDEHLAGQQLTLTWEQAREIGETLMDPMTAAMASALERGARTNLTISGGQSEDHRGVSGVVYIVTRQTGGGFRRNSYKLG